MTDQDFCAAMAVGIPPIAPPVDHRCACDPATHTTCDECRSAEIALQQHKGNS